MVLSNQLEEQVSNQNPIPDNMYYTTTVHIRFGIKGKEGFTPDAALTLNPFTA
jgi:hypothetical protein